MRSEESGDHTHAVLLPDDARELMVSQSPANHYRRRQLRVEAVGGENDVVIDRVIIMLRHLTTECCCNSSLQTDINVSLVQLIPIRLQDHLSHCQT